MLAQLSHCRTRNAIGHLIEEVNDKRGIKQAGAVHDWRRMRSAEDCGFCINSSISANSSAAVVSGAALINCRTKAPDDTPAAFARRTNMAFSCSETRMERTFMVRQVYDKTWVRQGAFDMPSDWAGKLPMQLYPSNVMSLNPCNLLASIIVSTLGFGAAAYGKKLGLWQPVAIGACLIIYPYFFTNLWLLCGIGAGLSLRLWFYHDE